MRAALIIGLLLASLPAAAQPYVDSNGRPILLSGKALQPLVTGSVGALARPHKLAAKPAKTERPRHGH